MMMMMIIMMMMMMMIIAITIMIMMMMTAWIKCHSSHILFLIFCFQIPRDYRYRG